jgi:hypothetical protein
MAPSTVETQGELRAQSARAGGRSATRPTGSMNSPSPDIEIRALHD